ncbi:MAG TPA: thrombospondin type 3 repeat-containing protein [Polyangia bacterium]|nr:thrombospondin type 3 repeat-containing protein [Polyangia bacterium]
MKWSIAFLAVGLMAGCTSPSSLLIEVTDTAPDVTFSSLKVQVFDPYGALGSHEFSPAPLPGALRFKQLPSTSEKLRVIVAGVGAVPSLGATAVMVAPGTSPTAQIDLTVALADSDGDGIPDDYDDCPTTYDPDQKSTNGGPPGDACGGHPASPDLAAADLSQSTLPPNSDMGQVQPIADLSPPTDLAGVLLIDNFTSNTLDTTIWKSNTDGGGTIAIANGMLTLTAPSAAAAFAEISSVGTFAVGTTFEASVNLEAGQTYDEKGIGYANARLSDDCQGGETEAAMFRGFNNELVIEPKAANLSQCLASNAEPGSYLAGIRDFKVVRLSAGQIDFYDNGTIQSDTARVPQGALPIRFGVFTSSVNPPSVPVVMHVDWVKVTKP